MRSTLISISIYTHIYVYIYIYILDAQVGAKAPTFALSFLSKIKGRKMTADRRIDGHTERRTGRNRITRAMDRKKRRHT